MALKTIIATADTPTAAKTEFDRLLATEVANSYDAVVGFSYDSIITPQEGLQYTIIAVLSNT